MAKYQLPQSLRFLEDIEPLGSSALPPDKSKQLALYTSLKGSVPFCLISGDGPLPIIFISKVNRDAEVGEFTIETEVSSSDFGSSLVLTVRSSGSIFALGHTNLQERVIQVVSNSPFWLVVHDQGKPLFVLRPDFCRDADSKERLRGDIERLERHLPIFLKQEVHDLLFLESIIGQPKILPSELISIELHLKIGWAKAFRLVLDFFKDHLQKYRDSYLADPHFENWFKEVGEGSKEFHKLILTNASVMDLLQFGRRLLNQKDEARGFLEVTNDESDFLGYAQTLHRSFLILTLHLPDYSDFGRRLTFLSTQSDLKVRFMEIRYDEITSKQMALEYWVNLPDRILIDSDLYIDNWAVPISRERLEEALKSIQSEKDATENFIVAKELSIEALALRKYVTPPGFTMEIPLGIFDFVRIAEPITNKILFALFTKDGYFLDGYIDLNGLSITMDSWLLSVEERNSESWTGFCSAIYLLMTACVRDLWVSEERDSMFSQRWAKKKFKVHGTEKFEERSRIIYLPRIRYTNRPGVSECASALELGSRQQSLVSGHLRRAQNPSIGQVELARFYGITIPSEHTFVRPHLRGLTSEKEIIYRSRSAMKLLYQVVEGTENSQTPKWFQFERDMSNLLASLGFEVEHRSQAKNGDDGIDIYARWMVAGEDIIIIVQCKCYAIERLVSRAAIRELMGTMAQQGAERAVGLIITTSRYSSESERIARENGIISVDGRELAELKASEPRRQELLHRLRKHAGLRQSEIFKTERVPGKVER